MGAGGGRDCVESVQSRGKSSESVAGFTGKRPGEGRLLRDSGLATAAGEALPSIWGQD